MKSNLILMPAMGDLSKPTPAVFWEVAAAKYVKLGIQEFRELVNQGAIPFRNHQGRRRRIYLKEDLDAYLRNLPRGSLERSRIVLSEDSSKPADKGFRIE